MMLDFLSIYGGVSITIAGLLFALTEEPEEKSVLISVISLSWPLAFCVWAGIVIGSLLSMLLRYIRDNRES